MQTEASSPPLPRLAWVLYAAPTVGGLAAAFAFYGRVDRSLHGSSVVVSVLPGLAMVALLAASYRALALRHAAALVLWGFAICGCCVRFLPHINEVLFPTFDITAWKLTRVVVNPLAEETSKGLGVLWALAFLPHRSWSAGFIAASLIGVGFGVFENIVYYDRAGVSWAMAGVRVPGTYMHAVFNACFGALLGLAWNHGAWVRWGVGVVALFVATLLHGSSNTVTSAAAIDVSGTVAAVLWLGVLFVVGRQDRRRERPSDAR